MTNKIMMFHDEYDFLSNMYVLKNPIMFDGILYKSSENLYQSLKFNNIKLRFEMSKLSPEKSKTEAVRHMSRSDWEKVKELIMLDVVRMKFNNNVDIAEKLIDTGYSELIEGNYWHDSYWGVCGCRNCRHIDGENKLGKILMQVREEIKNGNYERISCRENS